jgi:predicted RNase H-like HicB family nuclease
MAVRCILSSYVEAAMADADYDKLDDGTFSGQIPRCQGVIVFAPSLHECEEELRSTLEEWILLGLKLNHPLPVIAGIDLNEDPEYESMDAM